MFAQQMVPVLLQTPALVNQDFQVLTVKHGVAVV
jgi:hypothetical protein